MSEKILLVEDSPEMQLIVKATLGKRYRVHAISRASEVLEELARGGYALVLLDVDLPDEDGFKVCARIRADERTRSVNVVFLTGKGAVGDRVLGLSLGADDYVVKPFAPAELLARVESRMRRVREVRERHEEFNQGHFKVMLTAQKIVVTDGGQDRDLSLSGNEFKLLCYFIQHDGHVLSREQILNDVWGSATHVVDRTVDTHVCNLKKKLGNLSALIRSVPRMGYRFTQDQESLTAA